MESKEVKILLADDEKDFRQIVEFRLKSHGYDVRSCESGETALSLIKKDKPTIIFLDILMPRLGGIETLRRIREIDKNLPVIMLTTYPREENITEALKLGIDGFFPKSENLNRLLLLINSVLNRLKILKEGGE